VTRQRLYLEAMNDVFPMVKRKFIFDAKAGQLLPLMPLDINGAAAQPNKR
jgi:hypothetical protein